MPKGVAKKKQKPELDQFQVIFNSAIQGIVIKNIGGVIVDANKAMTRLLGYTAKEFSGKTIKELTFPQDYPKAHALSQKLIKGKVPYYHVDKRYIHKNGKVIWTQQSVSIVKKADKADFLVMIIQDISGRKQAEERLQEHLDDLRRMNKAMVGRELKMLDLKQELNRLKNPVKRVNKKKIKSLSKKDEA